MSTPYERIVGFKMERDCYESYPCQHRCTIKFSNGSKKTMLLSAPICVRLLKKMGKSRSHFAYLKNKMPSKGEIIIMINELFANN